MSGNLIIRSIETDNRITAQFSDKYLPRYARHGELYVVNGILYIYADLNSSDHGKWFPLTDSKEIYVYETNVASNVWYIPIDFHTDNLQVIIYDDSDRVYPHEFQISIEDKKVQVAFPTSIKGKAYLIVNKSFEWVDRKLIVGDKNFAVTVDEQDPSKYYLEVSTEYVKILKNGNTTIKNDVMVDGTLIVTGPTSFTGEQTLKGDVDIGGKLTIANTLTVVNKFMADADALVKGNLELNGDATIHSNLQVDGDTNINGNLTVRGTATYIQTEEIRLADNIITLNANETGVPTQNAGIEVVRGTESNVVIIQWNEQDDKTQIPNNTIINKSVEVEENAHIKGGLTVGSNTVLEGTLTTLNNVDISGTTTLRNDLRVNTSVHIDGTTTIDSDVVVGGNESVSGAVSVGLDLNVSGNSSVSGTSSFNGTATFNSNVTHGANQTVVGDVVVQGSEVIKTDLQVDGNTTLGGTTKMSGSVLTVGKTTLNDDLLVTGNVKVVGDSEVTGNHVVKSNLSVVGNTTLHGVATFNAPVVVNSTNTVNGDSVVVGNSITKTNSQIEGNLNVTGTSNFIGATVFDSVVTTKSDLVVEGNVILKTNLQVTSSSVFNDTTTFNADVLVNASQIVKNTLVVEDTLTAKTDLIVDGNQTVKTDLTVDGNSYVKGNTTIDGNLIVKGSSTYLQTEEIKLNDNVITLNSNESGTPSQNAGIEVTRGTEETITIIEWDENTDASHIPNRLIVDGLTTINSGLGVTGNVTVAGKQIISQTLNVGGDTTLNGDVLINASQTITGNLQVNGSANIDGNLTIQGENVNIKTTTLTVSDNIVTLNKGLVGAPTLNAGLEVDRGDEGVLSFITFDEVNDKVTVPVKQLDGTFLQDEVAGKIFVNVELSNLNNSFTDSLDTEILDRKSADNTLQNNIDAEKTARELDITDVTTLLNNETTRATTAESKLQANIDVEKGRIDEILALSESDKNSFKEVVDLIKSVDVENDSTFAGYVISNDQRSTNIESSVVAETNRATAAEDQITSNLQAALEMLGGLDDFVLGVTGQ